MARSSTRARAKTKRHSPSCCSPALHCAVSQAAKYRQYEPTHAASEVVIRDHLAFLRSMLAALPPGITLVLAGAIDAVTINGRPRTLTEVRGGSDLARMHRVYTEWVGRFAANMRLFDYLPLLCDATTCQQTVPGTTTPMMMDDNHLTIAGSKYLAPFWCDFFNSSGLATRSARVAVDGGIQPTATPVAPARAGVERATADGADSASAVVTPALWCWGLWAAAFLVSPLSWSLSALPPCLA